ncbi:MAG: N,N-dimethylformamidase, partial [Rhodospirillaceae bacterium]|nr:N,N-dimethylformamidase [Rhodospirillaceae bacterium]
AMIWPTLPERGPQTVMGAWSERSGAGYALVIDAHGCVALRLGDGAGGQVEVSTGAPLLAREWYRVLACYDPHSSTVRVVQEPLRPQPRLLTAARRTATVEVRPRVAEGTPFILAAHDGGMDAGRRINRANFNGKIDSPRLVARALDDTVAGQLLDAPETLEGLVAAWDFSREIPTDRIVDLSPNRLEGRLVNLGARAVTGYNWTGAEMDWKRAPAQYGAIHFHEDDLYDAGWQVDFSLTVPEGMRSGAYAAHVAVDGDEDHILFFVRPPRGTATAPLAFLASTATYMAYGNNHTAFDAELREMARGELIKLRKDDLFLNEHREYGLATYDHHADGTGVRYGSRLRPLLNMRPKTYQWSFNADTHIIDWLEATGTGYDVITDEDLHREGADLLARYRAVMTGTHPEYWSTPMWDAMDAYLQSGGRLLYMGGNGFYWRIAFRGTDTTILEVRRAETGTRAWIAEPGEFYHSFTGEYGGLWLRLGRPPNRLVGVGYIAQGFDAASWYRRQPGSFDPRAAWIFEGVGADEKIGDFGLIYGGAAGSEMDCLNRRLGSPAHALVLASSEQHTNVYYAAIENETELMPGLGAPENPAVRADMVFFETPNGGAVWSTGSIAWSGSLSHNGYDNNVSRITANVVRRFIDPTPF